MEYLRPFISFEAVGNYPIRNHLVADCSWYINIFFIRKLNVFLDSSWSNQGHLSPGRTIEISSKQECIAVGCIPPAVVAVGGVCVSACCDTPPWVWPWRNPPPGQTPQLPPWVWTWKPARHAGILPPLWCKAYWGTTCNACWDTTPPLWTEFLTHATENITMPQTSFALGNKKIPFWLLYILTVTPTDMRPVNWPVT